MRAPMEPKFTLRIPSDGPYPKVGSPFYGRTIIGPCAEFWTACFRTKKGLFFALEGMAFVHFEGPSVTTEEVHRRLLENELFEEENARCIAAFINRQLRD